MTLEIAKWVVGGVVGVMPIPKTSHFSGQPRSELPVVDATGGLSVTDIEKFLRQSPVLA